MYPWWHLHGRVTEIKAHLGGYKNGADVFPVASMLLGRMLPALLLKTLKNDQRRFLSLDIEGFIWCFEVSSVSSANVGRQPVARL